MDDLLQALGQDERLNAVDQEAQADAAFMVRIARIQAESAANAVVELRGRLDRQEQTINRYREENNRIIDRNHILEDDRNQSRYGLDTDRLRARLTHDEVLDLLWAAFGPRNFNSSEKIAAIKYWRAISGLGFEDNQMAELERRHNEEEGITKEGELE
jgi:hypothetical protein